MSEFVSVCPKCRQKILCDTLFVGQRVACPLCMQEITMPTPPMTPPAPTQSSPTAVATKRGIPVVAVVVGVGVLALAAGGALVGLSGRASVPSNPAADTTPPATPMLNTPPVARAAVPLAPSRAVNSSAPGIIIPNSGFEAPAVEKYMYNPGRGSWTFNTNGPASGSGVAAFCDDRMDSFTALNPHPPEGGQVAFLQSTGSISQKISGFIPGARYKISFDAAQRANNISGQPGETWNVLIGSTVVREFAPPQDATSFLEYSATFTAPAAENLVTFLGTDLKGGDNVILLDDVRITPAAQ